MSIDKPGEPESHLDSNWLARHRYQFDETCAGCHDVSNPGGTDNTSFCSNSACHATQWKYVGLDAPAIRALVEPPLVPGSGEPHPVPHPIGQRTDCDVCHTTDAVRPSPADHASYEQTVCTRCHQPTITEEEGEPQPVAAAPIPHTLEGRRDQCLTCHGEDGFKPYPTDHVGRMTETCLSCHEEAVPEGETASAGIEGGASAAPATPADHTGREDLCLSCHQPGGGVKPSPADHEGREVGVCLSCHVLAEEEQGVETSATPATESESEETGETETEAKETHEAVTESEQADKEQSGDNGPLPVRHSLEGRDDCLLCHNLDGVKPFPADHERRTSVMCLACHQPEGEGND